MPWYLYSLIALGKEKSGLPSGELTSEEVILLDAILLLEEGTCWTILDLRERLIEDSEFYEQQSLKAHASGYFGRWGRMKHLARKCVELSDPLKSRQIVSGLLRKGLLRRAGLAERAEPVLSSPASMGARIARVG